MKKIKNLECLECGNNFQCNDTKRNANRKFCSSFCAKSNNGKRNRGKQRSDECKRLMSEKMRGLGNHFFGKSHSIQTKKHISESNKGRFAGEKHPNWKDGLRRGHDGGYLRLTEGGYLHRSVMEKHLGRTLESHEHVHHKDGDVFNNDISNLMLVSNSEHRSIHAKSCKRDANGRFAK